MDEEAVREADQLATVPEGMGREAGRRPARLPASGLGSRAGAGVAHGERSKATGRKRSHVASEMFGGFQAVSVRSRSPEAGARERRLPWAKMARPGVAEHIGQGHTWQLPPGAPGCSNPRSGLLEPAGGQGHRRPGPQRWLRGLRGVIEKPEDGNPRQVA